MLRQLKSLRVPITIAVLFFVFGFFVTAGILDLSNREIVLGLITGLIAGVTTLTAVLTQDREGRTA